MSRSDALIARCDGCGREDGLRHPHRQEHLCPRCGNMYDGGNLARLHLHRLLEPVIAVWRAHWLERGIGDGFLDELVKDLEKDYGDPLTYTDR